MRRFFARRIEKQGPLDHLVNRMKTKTKKNLSSSLKNNLINSEIKSFDILSKEASSNKTPALDQLNTLRLSRLQNLVEAEPENELYHQGYRILKNVAPPIDHSILGWDFSKNTKPKEEINIKCVVSLSAYLDQNLLQKLLLNFFDRLIDRNFEKIKESADSLYAKNLQKFFNIEDGFEIRTDNLQEAKFDFEVYNITNVFGVDINFNRKKRKTFLYYNLNENFIEEVPCYFFTPKRTKKRSPILYYFVQLNINLYTDLKLELWKDGKMIKTGPGKLGDGEMYCQDLKLEVLVGEGGYKTLMKLPLDSKLDPKVTNHISEKEVKILEFGGAMNGNPFLYLQPEIN